MTGETTPDRPPEHDHLGARCPRCGLLSSFVERGRLSLSYADGVAAIRRPNPQLATQDVAAYQCRGCGQSTAVIEDLPQTAAESHRGIHWWPTPGAADQDPAIPEALRDAFSEGVRCLGANAPRAAAVMFRRTVEVIVDDKGSDKATTQLSDAGDLAGALKIMAKEKSLDPSLAEWAEEVRGLGNKGAHLDPLEDVTVAQAGELSDLLRQILHYLYEQPARVKRLRDSRKPAEAPEAE